MREVYDKLNVWLLKVYNSIRNEKGQGLVEYALILVLISIVVWMFLQGIGKESKNVYSTINSVLKDASGN